MGLLNRIRRRPETEPQAHPPAADNIAPEADRSGDLGGNPLAAGDSGPKEWCAVMFTRTDHGGEFQAIIRRPGHGSELVARSRQIRIGRSTEVPDTSATRGEHALLLESLASTGWIRLPGRGRWYETVFVRPVRDAERAATPAPPEPATRTPLRSSLSRDRVLEAARDIPDSPLLEPAAPSPVTEEPAAPEPEPVVEEPVAAEPEPEPMIAEPEPEPESVVEEPVAAKPEPEPEPVVEEPVAAEPGPEELVVAETEAEPEPEPEPEPVAEEAQARVDLAQELADILAELKRSEESEEAPVAQSAAAEEDPAEQPFAGASQADWIHSQETVITRPSEPAVNGAERSAAWWLHKRPAPWRSGDTPDRSARPSEPGSDDDAPAGESERSAPNGPQFVRSWSRASVLPAPGESPAGDSRSTNGGPATGDGDPAKADAETKRASGTGSRAGRDRRSDGDSSRPSGETNGSPKRSGSRQPSRAKKRSATTRSRSGR